MSPIVARQSQSVHQAPEAFRLFVYSVGRAGSVKHFLVALVIAPLAAGCVTSTHELQTVKAEVSYDQQENRTQRQRLEKRISVIETNLKRFDQAGQTKAQQENIGKRIAAVEVELRKIEKSSALAMQMGLISTVHADSNDKGIAGVRSELNKLTAELQALQIRLLQSDKQLETGLLQLKDLSVKLK
jgi:chromosome segregation ATPase